jgi:hypothetical protein
MRGLYMYYIHTAVIDFWRLKIYQWERRKILIFFLGRGCFCSHVCTPSDYFCNLCLGCLTTSIRNKRDAAVFRQRHLLQDFHAAVADRVARWYSLKLKITIWVKEGFTTAVWSIFGYLVYVVCCHLVYFLVIWYIFPVLVCCTKKNLATLAVAAAILGWEKHFCFHCFSFGML